MSLLSQSRPSKKRGSANADSVVLDCTERFARRRETNTEKAQGGSNAVALLVPASVEFEPGYAIILTKRLREDGRDIILFTDLPTPVNEKDDRRIYAQFLATGWTRFAQQMMTPKPYAWDFQEPLESLRRICELALPLHDLDDALRVIASGGYRHVPYDRKIPR